MQYTSNEKYPLKKRAKKLYTRFSDCGRSSVGRASPSQGECREFETHRPLEIGNMRA